MRFLSVCRHQYGREESKKAFGITRSVGTLADARIPDDSDQRLECTHES